MISRAHPLCVPVLLCLVVLLAAACTSSRAPATTPAASPPAAAAGATFTPTPLDQEMLALAFVSYTGEKITGEDDPVSQQLAPCFVRELAKQSLTEDWELVWGPMVYKFDLAYYNDNLMYVARHRDDPTAMAIGVRGTNGPAALDWLAEDFTVFDLDDWKYARDPGSLDPKISHGTRTGLEILQAMVPPDGVQGEGQDLATFLKAAVADSSNPVSTIYVTGHSLGGALSPALALWLHDTQTDWSPNGGVALHVFAVAGPTAGDADFSTYYDQRLGKTTRRVHNALGVPPSVWDVEQMRKIPEIYEPLVKLDEAEKIALDLVIDALKRKDYRHVDPEALPMTYRALNPKLTGFDAQVGWQHHCAYLCGLGIQPTFLPVSDDCSSTVPANPCPVCP